jgi:outer membrane receptor protein involved in Fe transport
MKYAFVRTVASLMTVVAVIGVSFAYGQGITTGSISGVVEDPTGAVVTGANITARHIDTNRLFKTETTASGIFSLRALPIGSYAISIESPHFRSYSSQGLGVSSGVDTALGTVRLVIGPVIGTMTVEGAAPLLESTTQQITNVFDSQKARDLPVGSNLDSLALFAPGVATAGDVSYGNSNGSGLSVNGQRSRSNNFQIDGQNNNDNSVSGPSILFGNQDAISEIQVVTNYSAEYGRNMGAVVNYITKSGTNNFHGSAYEFWAGNSFASLDNEEKSPLFSGPHGLPFCAPGQNPEGGTCERPVIPRYVDNRFGGTIGGPIKKDKVWFFGSANFERQRTGGEPNSSAPGVLPTPTGIAQLQTAFPGSPAAALLKEIGPSAVNGGNPVYSNLQNIGVSDVVGANCDPNRGPVDTSCVPIQFGTISRFVPSLYDGHEGTGRVDVQVTSKDNFFARYVFQQNSSQGNNFGNGVDVGDWQTVPTRNQQIGLDWVRNWTNKLVNQARFSYSRATSSVNEGGFTGCNRNSPLDCPTDILMLGSAPQDSVNFGVAVGLPEGQIINVYQVQDNASAQIGKMTLKIGGEYDKQRSPNLFLPFGNGAYFFNSFNDIVANNPSQVRLSEGDFHIPFKENDLAFYVQSDWRVKKNLTLNLGLRWEWFQQAINLLHNRTVARETGPHPFWDTSLPLDRRTVPYVPEDLNNFSPVVGFAWTPRIFEKSLGQNQTVIRGGFRISYDPAFYSMFLNVATAAPTTNAGQFVAPLPQSGFTGQDLIGFLAPDVPTGIDPGLATQVGVGRNFHNPYSEQWTLGIQRSVTPRVVAEVRYVGNHGVGNFQTVNGNPTVTYLQSNGFGKFVPSGLAGCADPTQPGYFGGLGLVDCTRRRLTLRQNSAWSKYNALQTELRIQDWHGLTATASYTWSHTIDNSSEVYPSIAGGNTLSFAQNPFDTDRAERANSGIDYPNVFGLTVIYGLPFAKHQTGFVGHVLGGWQLNSTYRYTSGQPWTAIQFYDGTFCDPTNTVSTLFDACRPILSNPAAPMATVGQCLNPVASDCGLANFVTGAPTTTSAVRWILNDDNAALFYGNPFKGAGRNLYRGQPVNTANLAVFKNTRMSDRLTLQFQAVAYNVMNTQFLGNPNPILDLAGAGTPPQFGTVVYNHNGGGGSTTDPVSDGIGRRRLVFGAKVIF